jgi:3-oxoadipate enol-lactonase
MPRCTLSDGAELYYEVEGDGPALIFAHGLGGNHLTWWQQVPTFASRYTCVTFAHRGFGLSTDPSGTPDPTKYADDLATLIDHLGLDDVRLVGQSMGGWTCMGYALRHPTRVRAMVLACTPGSATEPELDRIIAEHRAEGHRERVQALGVHPACGERMAREQPHLHYLYGAVSRIPRAVDSVEVGARLQAARVTPGADLARLTMPIMCITGDEDIVLTPAAVERLVALMPNATLKRVPEAGHSVYWERPATFNVLVGGFLEGAG